MVRNTPGRTWAEGAGAQEATLRSEHPLAVHEEVAFRDLWDEPFVAGAAGSGRWRDDWLAIEEREGHPVRVGAVGEQPDEWLGAIADGCGVVLAPGVRRPLPRPAGWHPPAGQRGEFESGRGGAGARRRLRSGRPGLRPPLPGEQLGGRAQHGRIAPYHGRWPSPTVPSLANSHRRETDP
ncbi:LysR substrate-binding domain-containing protein [Streptomyces melanogenes]|uniref:LysR substrate-binding domain-containing protein n=1 Tax=Streptomyces melanogenes TaxID=67326 RepID=UPI003AF33911